MAYAFSIQSVQAVQSSLIDVIRDWCAALGDDGTASDKWASPKDMSHWSAWVIFDSLGSLLFGQSFNTTRSVEHRPFLTLMDHNIWFLNILGNMPPLKQLKLGAVVMGDQGRKLGMRLAFARKLLQKRLDLGDHYTGPKDLVHYLMRAEHPETGKGFDEHELISEINMLLVAGMF
jgi:cytochrome P450